jgi:DNA-binding NarL/FixJ family response regulator
MCSNIITLDIPQNLIELSPREKEIVTLIIGGYTNKEIAVLLSIELTTVVSHAVRIHEKWQVKNRAQLVAYFVFHYFIPPQIHKLIPTPTAQELTV